MALEGQLVSALQQKEQLEELINDLLSGSRRQLWEDNP
jgi:hypothetical protein